ncbi:MAG TPA: hopanoid biosynthesis associated radical SAM protein HpnJ [Candidatus Baltobacteraceae bacterium]|nr:hopanoid biosynthesis associated radical SAM protein HpnJ [Candidatus Baltobacteraceae bacterium]
MLDYKKTLFVNPPSFEGFDGGAGARYQCRREVRSFWYPTWLAQPAAMIPGSKLVDAPPDDLTVDQVAPMARDFDLIVIHTSTPSFANDARFAARVKEENPNALVGMVGAHVYVLPEHSLEHAPAVDWVSTQEFDYTCVEIAQGKPFSEVGGIAYRENGGVVKTPDRPTIMDMDAFPSVLDVYKRDLTIKNYFNGYLQHPYISLYTGRGCKSRCTFCIWPQTISGHLYRVKSVDLVEAEMRRGKELFPEVKEWFFDDDTLTDNAPRVEELARRLGKLGITWSCNAKPNVSRSTLEVLKENGLRLLLVGYESGVQDILNSMKKGTRLDHIRTFTKDCHELGIKIHGTFILGIPGETPETIRQTIEFACEMNPETLQVSLAAPYPGTFLYNQARENGWLQAEESDLVDVHGVQHAALNYPGLLTTDMLFDSVDDFYRKFYFRPRKMFSLLGGMIADPQVMKRRLREGKEFFQFLRERKKVGAEEKSAAAAAAAV